jgi:hypothetical protein
MGKYSYRENLKHMIEKYPEYTVEKYVNESSKLFFLEKISNELAEANRLKRWELKMKYPSEDKYGSNYDEEDLEDKA